MIINEKIKVSEVMLTGLEGEDLGVVSTVEALSMARKLKADLVCESLMSFPPPCRLIAAGTAAQEKSRKREREPKVKEIRLSPHIEEHDYETKKQQTIRILKSGDAVMLVVRLQGKGGDRAKALLEQLLQDVSPWGRKKTNVQLNNKQAAVQVDPNPSAHSQ